MESSYIFYGCSNKKHDFHIWFRALTQGHPHYNKFEADKGQVERYNTFCFINLLLLF